MVFKPYKSITITDNILKYDVGAMNIEACKINGASPTNLLEFGFEKGEKRIHEAQKPVKIRDYSIFAGFYAGLRGACSVL